ncbi:MAG: DNA helicase RecQ [Raoultibacter sp.]
MIQQAEQVLRDYFGHAEFRPNQRELISQLLSGRDIVGVMPTGAGKSLIYQIPALVSDGITIVVSPLISLMKDQVNALNQVGAKAAFLNSSISSAEQSEVLEYAASGSCNLLYVAPERLDAPRFVAFTKTAKISLVAVDEAHCVSQWGQDFRPSYLGIARFIEGLPSRPPVCALTATATPAVQDDIATALELHDPFMLVSGFDRPNLYFGVERPEPKAKRSCLLRLVRERSAQSGIVYCTTRAAVEEVCALLCDNGMPATRYHAGLSAAERHKNQDDFLFDRKPIMVATNAFGMGIDKSNVSFVIHFNMPSDVESYYQEAGRAGRDGEPADCILIYNKKDVQTCQFLIDKSFEERSFNEADETSSRAVHERDCERLRHMVFYCTTVDCLRTYILRYFGQTENPYRCEHCSNCSTEFEVEDMTVEAQKILSCVLRLEQRNRRVGKAMIIDILRGSKAEKLLGQHLDELTTYGIMSDVPAKRVRYILDALIAEGLLEQTDGSYPVVAPTQQGTAFLKERKYFAIKVPKRLPKDEVIVEKKSKRRGASGGSADPVLFEKLKDLRSKLAAEQGVPAYIVFTNAALTDMCAKKPTSEAAFLEVSGVGRVKAERYGQAFLDVIAEHLS